MPRLKQAPTATTTTEVVTKVKLSTKAMQLLKQRADEHARLAAEVAIAKARQKAIEKEVDYVFTREQQGKALADGTKVDGIGFKLVTGSTAKFDKLAFMKKHGLTEEDFEEFTERNDNEPYIRITVPKAKGGSEE